MKFISVICNSLVHLFLALQFDDQLLSVKCQIITSFGKYMLIVVNYAYNIKNKINNKTPKFDLHSYSFALKPISQ